ncbi:MAG: hypothetical protein M5Z89_08520 [Olivibacter sp.]|nr:hypothetical protein [Olivibacter sp. UJ_SKK_5.1]
MEKDFKYFEIVSLNGNNFLLCQPEHGFAKQTKKKIVEQLEREYGQEKFKRIMVIRRHFYYYYFSFCARMRVVPSYRMAKMRYSRNIRMTMTDIGMTLAILALHFYIIPLELGWIFKWVVGTGMVFIAVKFLRLYHVYRQTYLVYWYEERRKENPV